MFFAPGALADDAAVAAIKKAIQFQKEVRAYRIKESMTDVVDGNKQVESTTEVVNPDQMHRREVVNGKLDREWFTDGKTYLIRESPEAELKEETEDAAGGIKILQESARLPAPKPEEVQLTGHETIDGQPVSIYTRVLKSETVTKETLRIADKDNRLLDRSGETKGELRLTDHTIPENFFWHTTYEYDPSIKIVLPPAVKSSPSPSATPQQAETDQTPFDELKTKAEAGDAEHRNFSWGVATSAAKV